MKRSKKTSEYLELHSKLYCVVNGSDCYFGLKNCNFVTEMPCTYFASSQYCNYELSFSSLLSIYTVLVCKYFENSKNVLPF